MGEVLWDRGKATEFVGFEMGEDGICQASGHISPSPIMMRHRRASYVLNRKVELGMVSRARNLFDSPGLDSYSSGLSSNLSTALTSENSPGRAVGSVLSTYTASAPHDEIPES